MTTLSSETATAGLAYPWVEPSSVKTDGKYRVTANREIRLDYTIGRREMRLVTDAHPALAKVVMAVKSAHGEPPSGVFYLNEWQHVLVKAGGGTWYAGRYAEPIQFDLDGSALSTSAPADMRPGDIWTGPRVGIRYTVTASGTDVYCKRRVSQQTEVKEYLSDYFSSCEEVVKEWSRHKPGGGAVYINEARELFAPANGGESFVYLGRVTYDQWFPMPGVDES